LRRRHPPRQQPPDPSRNDALLALCPAILILAVEGGALAFAALGGARGTVEAAVYALWIGLPAGVVAPVVIAAKHRGRAAPLCVLSVAATFCALLLGFAIWSQAVEVACHGLADCPLG